MNKVSMKEILKNAKTQGYAVGAFNIFNHISARAVIAAAEEMKKPVIVQTSVGTVKYYGVSELAGMIKVLSKGAAVPVYLHLDHCTDVELAKACVDAGWDTVMIDASKYPLAENIRITKEVSDYAHAHQVDVEGELGVIEGVEEDIQADSGVLAKYEDCIRFVKESHVDIFAPALGTAHGVYKGVPNLNYELVERLGNDLDEPIVCHGGTGLSKEAFERLITKGVSKVNISTALKHAYIDGTKKYLDENPDKYAPLELDEAMFKELKKTVKEHIELFNNGR